MAERGRDAESASSLAKNWPYADYHVTIFSTGEEEALEDPNGLGGYVQFDSVNALAEAGAHVDTYRATAISVDISTCFTGLVTLRAAFRACCWWCRLR